MLLLPWGHTGPPQEGLGGRQPTDLVFALDLKTQLPSPNRHVVGFDSWEEHISKLHLKAGVGINNSNLNIYFIFLILLH